MPSRDVLAGSSFLYLFDTHGVSLSWSSRAFLNFFFRDPTDQGKLGGNSVDSYHIVRQAILDKCSLSAIYQNKTRHFCPHAIGRDDSGDINIMAFQYAGQSSHRLPPNGEWRYFRVRGLSSVVRNGDAWHTGWIMAGVTSVLRELTYRFADCVFGPSEVAYLTLCVRSVNHRSDWMP